MLQRRKSHSTVVFEGESEKNENARHIGARAVGPSRCNQTGEQVAPQMGDPENPPIYFSATDGLFHCVQVMTAWCLCLTHTTEL